MRRSATAHSSPTAAAGGETPCFMFHSSFEMTRVSIPAGLQSEWVFIIAPLSLSLPVLVIALALAPLSLPGSGAQAGCYTRDEHSNVRKPAALTAALTPPRRARREGERYREKRTDSQVSGGAHT